jgi:DNA-binding MarR family transcriptional regulator/ribosomal protein S18 acetylase RimI-like enzyme
VDVITELRELALASRLRRLSELMMKDASALYGDLGIEFEARWFATFYALAKKSPMAVTELAHALGMTHPAITNLANQLIKRGLVQELRDPRDERRRLLQLTPRAMQLRDKLAPVWEEIRRAARALLDEVGVDLLGDLQRVESAFAERTVADRARTRLALPPRKRVEIVEYRPAYKKHFRALNERWLKECFTVEKEDARLLNDPNRQILKKGGEIVFALLDSEVVGTCALLCHKGNILELSKMAVAPEARRRGIGTALAGAVLARARDTGARWLYLQTNPRLRPANRLYRRLGFRRVSRSPLPPDTYRRHSVVMRLSLEAPRQRARKEES